MPARAKPDEALRGVGEASFPTGDAISGGQSPKSAGFLPGYLAKSTFSGISVQVSPVKFAEDAPYLLCAALCGVFGASEYNFTSER